MTDSSPSILAELGLTPAQTPELRSNDRSRLLNFLLRWDYIAELHACLDAIMPRSNTCRYRHRHRPRSTLR